MSEVYRGGAVLAEVERSGFVEGFHRGSVAIVDATGRLCDSVGDVDAPIFPRSSNKPMQTVAALRCGFPFTDAADLAIASASHQGEPFHLAAVSSLLERAGLSEADLRCPPAWPKDPDAHHAAVAAGGSPTRLAMNCSGKHAAMLATCRVAGWSLTDYLSPDHPLQRANARTVAELTGHDSAVTGVDGCGAPLFAASLAGLAEAFRRLVTAEPGTLERAVADAMRARPELVSGTHGFDTRLMRAVPGALAKIGAEAVQAVAIPGVGAVAVKIDDGNVRASGPVAVAALRRLGLSDLDVDADELDRLAITPLLGAGHPVGAIRPVWP